MGELELHFVGELEVLREGEVMRLPPSRKTRALLAYLALQRRGFRREHLCELLWEIPDDPRGSLRWSLSKLRRLVDDGQRQRILADRATVSFDAADVVIDAVRLQELASCNLDDVAVDRLEEAARRYRGNFLEGLDLPNFHQFHAWCMAERERVAEAQAAILGALVQRLAGEPERALPHARALATASPYDEAARAALIRLLVRSRRAEEAEQQYRIGLRMLREVGVESSGALFSAWRGSRGAPDSAATPAPPATADRAPLASLVGRDREVRELTEALRRVTGNNRAELVLLCGEPGLGKSRLLETVAAAAREAGAAVLEASAFESESIRPFALWVDGLRKLGRLPDVFVTASPRDDRDRLLGALSDLVAEASAERPVVLLFDDLQWCDESSAAALHYVARMNRERPLLAVLAGREGELHDNGPVQQCLRGLRHEGLVTEMRLPPLSEADARTLIHEWSPEADADRLSRECAGNPLLAIELARAEAAGDSGRSLEELIRERLARLDPEATEVLQWAAVLAPRIDLPALTRLSGIEATRVAAALELGERHALLAPAERGFRFRHDLLGRGVYAQISPARRQAMHRRVAELLEQDTALDLEHAADLAHHATQSGDPALAARAMVSAGRLCLRFFANDEAASLARRGLTLAIELTAAERVRLELDLHDVLLTAVPLDDWESTAERCVALAEQALDHGALSHASLGYHMASYLRWAHGHWTDAREQTLQVERIARGGSDTEHIAGMAETGKCLAMLERDLSHADALLMEAQALARRQGLGHRAIPTGLGILRYHENRLDEAEELFEEARMQSKSAGDRVSEFQANEYLVMIAFQRGSHEEARRRCRALLTLAERLRDGSEAPFARTLDALCDYALSGDSAPLDAALVELRAADAKYRLSYVQSRAALLDLDRGRPEAAKARAEEALEAATALERSTEMLLARVALARACQAGGDGAAARCHLDAIEALDGAPAAAWARQLREPLEACS